MTDIFLDPSVLLLAVGGEHLWRAACRRVLASAADGTTRLNLSVEGGQEYLFHRLRCTSREAAVAEFGDVDALAVWHSFDRAILHAARDLVRDTHLRGRDAVHAATALAAGFGSIVSCDSDFDGIPGLRRVDPTAL
ncbi:MAG: PIN domain-containing protein [Tetrasphaera sp.]